MISIKVYVPAFKIIVLQKMSLPKFNSRLMPKLTKRI